jgi:hypothetical protein
MTTSTDRDATSFASTVVGTYGERGKLALFKTQALMNQFLIIGCVSGGHCRHQDSGPTFGAVHPQNAVPATGMQIIVNESLREFQGYSAVAVRAVLLPRTKI